MNSKMYGLGTRRGSHVRDWELVQKDRKKARTVGPQRQGNQEFQDGESGQHCVTCCHVAFRFHEKVLLAMGRGTFSWMKARLWFEGHKQRK